jgi:hypothetical protein
MSDALFLPIGLADSALDGYVRDSQKVVVRVKCWNEKVLLAEFNDVLALRDSLAGDFSDLVRNHSGSSHFLEEALRFSYEQLPENHSYSVYTFLNNDAQPSLEIVAASCEVHIE